MIKKPWEDFEPESDLVYSFLLKDSNYALRSILDSAKCLIARNILTKWLCHSYDDNTQKDLIDAVHRQIGYQLANEAIKKAEIKLKQETDIDFVYEGKLLVFTKKELFELLKKAYVAGVQVL